MTSETVEVHGHLIDSGVLSRVLDDILEYGGDYSIDKFEVGKTPTDESYARLTVKSDTDDDLSRLIMRLQTHGVNPTDPGEAPGVIADWHEREAWQCEQKLTWNDAGTIESRVPALAVRHHMGALLAKHKDANLYYRRGTAAFLLGDPQAAVTDLSHAINPSSWSRDRKGSEPQIELRLANDPLLRLRRGRSFDVIGQREAAVADVAFAFELGQEKFLDQTTRWEKAAAIAGLNSRLEKNGEDWKSLELRANLHWELADFEGALRDCDRLIAAGHAPWFVPSLRAGDHQRARIPQATGQL